MRQIPVSTEKDESVALVPADMSPGQYARSIVPALDFMIGLARNKSQVELAGALEDAKLLAVDLGRLGD